jgi:hypothetical protein
MYVMVERRPKRQNGQAVPLNQFHGIPGSFYPFLLVNRVTQSKRCTILGYSLNHPQEVPWPDGWELAVVFEPFVENDAYTFCKEWARRTRGIHARIEEADRLSLKYHVNRLQ